MWFCHYTKLLEFLELHEIPGDTALKNLVWWGRESQEQAVAKQFHENYGKKLIAQASGDPGRQQHTQKSGGKYATLGMGKSK